MFDQTQLYPPEIKALMDQLLSSPNIEQTLINQPDHKKRESPLINIYRELKFNFATNSFQGPISPQRAVSLLQRQFNLPPLEPYWSPQKVKSSPDLQYDSTPSMFGLELDNISPLIFEESSLMSVWNDHSYTPPSRYLTPLIKSPPTTTFRSRNGLKALSWRVKEIVEKHGKTTYKDVADQLLKELEIPQTPLPMKDQKNVRRRVYDALNVLIAAKVIDKKGKIVASKILYTHQHSNEEDLLVHKRARLRNLVEDYKAVKNLYERNTLQNKSRMTVPYPLHLVLLAKGSSHSMTMQSSGKNCSLKVQFTGKVQILKDIEILKRLGLQLKTTEIPNEIIKLCRDR